MVDDLIDDVIAREGGYVRNASDKGGATRWGITEKVARQTGYRGDMRRYPRSAAVAAYHQLYWIRPGFDSIAERASDLAAELFDTGVNMGPSVATTFLQRALNALNRGARDYPDTVADGMVGPRTLAAVDGFLLTRGEHGEDVLVKAIDALQGARYLRLAERRPTDEAFLYGWLANRIG